MDTEQLARTFIEYFEERGHRRITGSTLLPPSGDPCSSPHPGCTRSPPRTWRPAASAGQQAGQPAALPAHHRPGRGRRRHPSDRLRDARQLVAGRLRGPRSLEWGLRAPHRGPGGIDPGLLHATVYAGDEGTERDTASLRVWQDLGVPVEPTVEDNWCPTVRPGRAAPDSEIFLWSGEGPPVSTPTGGTTAGWRSGTTSR